MKQIFDENTANQVKAEEQAYSEWVYKQKNRILAMANEKRKQVEWNKLFTPVTKPDDSYLVGGVY